MQLVYNSFRLFFKKKSNRKGLVLDNVPWKIRFEYYTFSLLLLLQLSIQFFCQTSESVEIKKNPFWILRLYPPVIETVFTQIGPFSHPSVLAWSLCTQIKARPWVRAKSPSKTASHLDTFHLDQMWNKTFQHVAPCYPHFTTRKSKCSLKFLWLFHVMYSL